MEHVTRRACRGAAGSMAFSYTAGARSFALPALSFGAALLRPDGPSGMTPLPPVRVVHGARWRE